MTQSDQSESAAMRELLREVAMAGVSYDEPRVGYVEVQINRATWQELQDWRVTDQSDSAMRERVAEAYAGYRGFLGADGWSDMEGADRQRCREVVDVVLAAARLASDEEDRP